MRILVTGAAGRVGRAICNRLRAEHDVIGLDQAPSSTTDVTASIADAVQIRKAMRGVEAVIHTAALHAPHVGHASERTFETVNVGCTETLARIAAGNGVRSFVFTSTTALYGAAATPQGGAAWIDEDSVARPRTIYHRTKLAAESILQAIALETALPVTVLRMSRCFPEPAPLMAAYRLHRGVDVRDVADAHVLAATEPSTGFRRYVVSGSTPFRPEDSDQLMQNAPDVIEMRCPELADAFRRRDWELPRTIDRVYVSARATHDLHWRARYGFEEVLAQLDRRSLEVLPPQRREPVDE